MSWRKSFYDVLGAICLKLCVVATWGPRGATCGGGRARFMAFVGRCMRACVRACMRACACVCLLCAYVCACARAL
eukprot:6220226-Alexandrium_andersonii.AAC.1